ncbi:Epsin-3, clathrin recruitment and traffic between the Golgi and endosome [Kickxella alabastrina]|nr:Epsin-3, clathrin recruitment and traffic between the Golgi and endosome [Kickxella alabastrina]
MDKLSEISKWDVLNVYNKVKNVVMNYTEFEIKVNEATGPEPWGASSTLMREIADGTNNRKYFEEIMPAIYLRFNDTDPSNWRQVYKALQLLEYLIKNGSERVVDEVQSHVTVVKMLKNFHHIDANGKDQGINVRQRSKEIVDLMHNREQLRDERKKAKENRNKYNGFSGSSKYVGFGSNTGGGGSVTSGTIKYFGVTNSGANRSSADGNSRFVGFGSDSYVPSTSHFEDRSESGSSNYRFEFGDRRSATPTTFGNSSVSGNSSRQKTPVATKPVTPVPVMADLFSFDDEIDTGSNNTFAAPPGAATSNFGKSIDNAAATFTMPPPASAPVAKAPAVSNALDDDWGDFQSSNFAAVSTSTPVVQPPKPQQQFAPTSIAKNNNLMMDLLGGDDIGFGIQPLPVSPTSNGFPKSPISPGGSTFQRPLSPMSMSIKKPDNKAAQKSGAFSDIWDMSSDLLSLDSLSLSKKANGSGSSAQNQSARVSMNQLSGQSRSPF